MVFFAEMDGALLVMTTKYNFGWAGSTSGLKLLVKYRTADMNTLIAIGTLAAYCYVWR